ncbi:hypothetical protein Leryth_000598 [Lithospermum erythrorhizon]|nr:hypothetical protein Leryth_000598 [Lithospermum erythrorhizon]
MDEHEFRSALELFPIVRPRDFHLIMACVYDAFWNKLKAAAEKKVGTTDAERFCKAFKQVYEKLVYEELSQDAAQSLMNLTIS